MVGYTISMITQEMLVFLSGIILFLVPFLGIPTDWKFYLTSGLGLLLLLVGYRLRYRRAVRELAADEPDEADQFVEATPALFDRSKATE